MHDALTIGIPVVVILLGILFNKQDNARLESRMEKLDGKMDTRFDVMQRDMRDFYRTIGQHDTRLEHLERKTNG